MRSDAIFRAKKTIENRYQLCQTASKTMRKLHVPTRDTQETINTAFQKIAEDRTGFAEDEIV
ncbi:MAG: DNA-directed RNA polymerase subunit omega [Edaphobacter sp.]|uniref:DNA-directed RNA polymerase subunit omega n=1 Tax=Edaphobacter sp. TaxID=1934404 RepID=UPI0023A5A6C1|nr:DNA-directed RNA polymerase subunit omega [Edaphobacter sp.]MDE1176883.1 DNA-directed RNA polymerase subunit omega [Edaphobacter sp.]